MRAFPKGHRPEREKVAEKILGAAVIGTTVLASPVAGAAVFALGFGALSYFFRKSDFNREVTRLHRKGYIALTKTGNSWIVKILEKGKKRFKEIEMQNLQLQKNKEWDGKWRLFIFDIPEGLRFQRDYLRRKLKGLGFFNIQRSAFVYPFDCRNELELIADYYNISEYSTYAEVGYIDIDKELRKHFNLRK